MIAAFDRRRAGRRAQDQAHTAESAAAQQQGGGPLPGLDNGDMTPGEIQRLFDAYLVMEAQQALQLTDQQYPQFCRASERCRTRAAAISRNATN